jgi:hypothetical protein
MYPMKYLVASKFEVGKVQFHDTQVLEVVLLNYGKDIIIKNFWNEEYIIPQKQFNSLIKKGVLVIYG